MIEKQDSSERSYQHCTEVAARAGLSTDGHGNLLRVARTGQGQSEPGMLLSRVPLPQTRWLQPLLSHPVQPSAGRLADGASRA